MNVDMLIGPSGQSLLPESHGAVNHSAGAIGSFSEIMEALTAQLGKQGDLVIAPDADLPASNQAAMWLGMWLNTLEQLGDGQWVLVDAAEEIGQLDQDETPVSLTELMAALQPLVNQSLANTVAAPNQAAILVEQALGQTVVAAGSTDGLDPTAVASFPSTAMDASLSNRTGLSQPTEVNSAASKQLASVSQAGNEGQNAPTLESKPPSVTTAVAELPNSAVRPQRAELMEAATPRNSAQPGATMSNIIDKTGVDVVGPKAEAQSPIANLSAADQPKPALELSTLAETDGVTAPPPRGHTRSNIELPPAASSTLPSAAVTNFVTAGEPALEPASGLTDVPALTQIKDAIGIITRQGETSVRLHLHPESLGQVLVQLDKVGGEMVVRMLAETAQAQALIQDHLPQLKAAFMAQGLQVHDLTVSVGSNTAAFDAPGHQSQSGSHSPANQQPPSTPFDETGHLTPAPSDSSGPWTRLSAIDYHV